MNIQEIIFYINETFISIQGEGHVCGQNALFIRFQFCNLRCAFCDTKYALNHREKNFHPQTATQLNSLIAAYKGENIIYTGGEPLLYPLDHIRSYGKRIYIETNGLVEPDQPYRKEYGPYKIERPALSKNFVKKAFWTVSPKYRTKKTSALYTKKQMNFYLETGRCIFKFIAKNFPEDLNKVENFMKRFDIPRRFVYVGLEGTTRKSQNRPDAVSQIIDKGFNFSPRLHIWLWENQKGK